MGSKKQGLGFIILIAVLIGCQREKEPEIEPQRTQIVEECLQGDDFTIHCRNAQAECGVPAPILAAIAILESHCGKSELAQKTNNHFGRKAFADWKGETYTTANGEKYIKYKTAEDGYYDTARFLHDNYINAVGHGWEHWVKYCKGYGGDGYWKVIGRIIELNNLQFLQTFGPGESGKLKGIYF